MEHLGISFDIQNHPELDPGFLPLHSFNKAFLSGAKKPLGIAVERADGQMAAVETFIHGTPELRAADEYYVNRLVKTILWMKGGYKIYVRGDDSIRDYGGGAARGQGLAQGHRRASGRLPHRF